MAFDLYQTITDKIIAQFEAGTAPWAQPWKASSAAPVAMPRNAVSGRPYSGINVLLLWMAGGAYSSGLWLTFKQAKALGGSVNKGEHGTMIVYASRFTPKDAKLDADGNPKAQFFLKAFTVFNVAQCSGLPAAMLVSQPAPEAGADLIAAQVRELIDASGAKVRIGGDQAFYATGPDFIQVPSPEAYFEPINWHRTLLHELTHWTGHESRLNRLWTGARSQTAYAREELVAEMGAAFLCAMYGVEATVRHVDYIGSWIKLLRDDKAAIVQAASMASKAADYLASFVGTQHAPDEIMEDAA